MTSIVIGPNPAKFCAFWTLNLASSRQSTRWLLITVALFLAAIVFDVAVAAALLSALPRYGRLRTFLFASGVFFIVTSLLDAWCVAAMLAYRHEMTTFRRWGMPAPLQRRVSSGLASVNGGYLLASDALAIDEEEADEHGEEA